MSYSKGTHKVVDHRRSLYQTKKKAETKELEVDGNTYIITIPSRNEFAENDKYSNFARNSTWSWTAFFR